MNDHDVVYCRAVSISGRIAILTLLSTRWYSKAAMDKRKENFI